jgi:hypothetical protein
MVQLHIFTIGSDESQITHLKESATMAGVEINVVVPDVWTGYVDKIIRMKTLIQDLPDEDVVCFIDAYDVLVYGNETEILQKFQDYQCNVVLSSELSCYPPHQQTRYDDLYAMDTTTPLPSNFKYVNSGGYIGYKKSIMEIFEWKTPEDTEIICQAGGDQNYFTEYFLEYSQDEEKKVIIDASQTLFQSMHKIEFGDFEFHQGRVYNKILETYPAFVHFNSYNLYGMSILNLHTNEKENCCQVFNDKARVSRENNSIETLHYTVLFLVVFNGIVQHRLPQK